ncbi:hypothetical protein [Micromonospora sp. DT233]|uniref:hypothetical protein n=1 Tax=Micromonospora sp. DT233 TaxID=3393432 RepID=UPI003CFB6432
MRTRLGNFLLVLLGFVLGVPYSVAIFALIVTDVQEDWYPYAAGGGTVLVVAAVTIVAAKERFWPALLTTPCGCLAGWGVATAVAALERTESGDVVIGAAAGVAGFVLGPLSALLIPLHEPQRTFLDIFDIF